MNTKEYQALAEQIEVLWRELGIVNLTVNADLEKTSQATEPLRLAYVQALQTGDVEHRKRMASEYAELERLRGKISFLQKQLSNAVVQCNHKDEDGNTLLTEVFSYGQDDEAGGDLKCKGCGRTWEAV